MKLSTDNEITTLLYQWSSGDPCALQRLFPLIYRELHKLALNSLNSERSEHTLQPTALLHEAYLRLSRSPPAEINDSRHFYCLTAQLMRQILVDHARKIFAKRRRGKTPHIPFDDKIEQLAPDIMILELNELLESLAKFDQRKTQVVELRYFAGFEVKEVASLLDISVSTVISDTKIALAWLFSQIKN